MRKKLAPRGSVNSFLSFLPQQSRMVHPYIAQVPRARGAGQSPVCPNYSLSVVIFIKKQKASNCAHEVPLLSSVPQLSLFWFLWVGEKPAYLKR